MTESAQRVTRGCGFFETFLAKQRANQATALIGKDHGLSRILDIGCGTQPYFLTRIQFAKKYGLDNFSVHEPNRDAMGMHLMPHDIESDKAIPFEDHFFDVVTMLAVFEHILPERLPATLNEIHRILKPGGLLIMTTPAGWTDGLLRFLAKVNLVSSEEIEEHKDVYSHQKIKSVFEKTNFKGNPIEVGTFECFMNLWAKVRKN